MLFVLSDNYLDCIYHLQFIHSTLRGSSYLALVLTNLASISNILWKLYLARRQNTTLMNGIAESVLKVA